MRRALILTTTLVLVTGALPASAHKQAYDDGLDDAWWYATQPAEAHQTPLDLAGGSFKHTKNTYKVRFELQSPLDMAALCDDPPACLGGDEGLIYFNVYTLEGQARTNFYVIRISAGEDVPTGLFARYNADGSCCESLSAPVVKVNGDSTKLTVTVPRSLIEGQPKGTTVYWDEVSEYWYAEGSADFCNFDQEVFHLGACTDLVPETGDAVHVLKN